MIDYYFTCVEELELLPGEEYVGLRLRVDPVQEVRAEELGGEVERVLLDVEEGDEQLDDLLGRELDELLLQNPLQLTPELEPGRRLEVEVTEHSGNNLTNNSVY